MLFSLHKFVSRLLVTGCEDNAPVLAFRKVLHQMARFLLNFRASNPHIDIISIIKHQQPLTCTGLAQINLQNPSHIRIVFVPSRKLKLAADVEIRLLKTLKVYCKSPKNKTFVIIFPDAINKLDHQVRLAYASKPGDGNLPRQILGK